MSDYDYDDRCDDEAAEGRRWDMAMDRAALHGVPFDPVLEGVIEADDEELEEAEALEPDVATEVITGLQDSLNHLAEIYGEEITDHIELVRALRWQIEHYKAKPREMQECIDELEERVRDLEDSNFNLRAMLATARRAA